MPVHKFGEQLASKALAILLALLLTAPAPAPVWAGGPIQVGGPPAGIGVEGQPFTWAAGAIPYQTDGGTLGTLDNATANNRVLSMFNKWQNVTTSTIAYSRTGGLTAASAGADLDVTTVAEFNAVEGTCNANPPTQNPVIYDTNGSIFTGLGIDAGVIGFAGPCLINDLGRIISGEVALNGKWIDGNAGNGELTDSTEFDGAIIHEIGHFSGLDHSQINVNCLNVPCGTDDLIGLPTMFPVVFEGADEDPGLSVVNPTFTLATDDIAWISRLYPAATFNTTHGTLTGIVRFSDGVTHAQDVNVIARPVDTGSNQDRKFAVSVVSGFKFTGNPGQNVTGDNTGGDQTGSRQTGDIGLFEIPVPAGNYTIEVETIDASFNAGSSVGPLAFPIAMPGTAPAPAGPFNVTVGNTTNVGNIVLVNTPPRYDTFEGP